VPTAKAVDTQSHSVGALAGRGKEKRPLHGEKGDENRGWQKKIEEGKGRANYI